MNGWSVSHGSYPGKRRLETPGRSASAIRFDRADPADARDERGAPAAAGRGRLVARDPLGRRPGRGVRGRRSGPRAHPQRPGRDRYLPELSAMVALLARPAAVQSLVTTVPVSFLAFDLLHLEDRALLRVGYAQRRTLLEDLGIEGRAGAPHRRSSATAGLHWPPARHRAGGRGGQAQHVGLPPGYPVAGLDQGQEHQGPGGRRRRLATRRRNRAGGSGSLLVGVSHPAGLGYADHVGT